MENKEFEIVVKTFYGLEEVLAVELKELGANDIQIGNRAVTFKGDLAMLYRVNLNLRTAISVLVPIATFKANNEDELYKNVFDIDWDQYIQIKKTFAVDPVVYSTIFKHSQYAALKVKDAIVDQYRKKHDRRPYVDTEKPDVLINLYISENECTLSLNSSGDPLFKRGYRSATSEAPLNEVLAAGIIKLSGWDAKTNLIDPMCGSGTILIEAALMAYGIPPGIFRSQFGFENWIDFDSELFQSISVEGEENEKDNFEFKIIGSDISPKAIGMARTNINNAFLQNKIDVFVSSFEELKKPVESGIIITNPPYGERIKPENINELYANIGNTLKKDYAGFDAWILTSNRDAMRNIALHPSQKIKLNNGALECTFNRFELYQGSKKASKQS
jgi:putative N6-adenine-specific DNA methylase